MAQDVSVDDFKAAMGSFAAGVTVVTSVDDAGVPYGLTATAFMSVSKDPPQCLIGVADTAEAHPVILRSGRFAVNLLSDGQSALATQFAATGADKFHAVRWQPGPATGCPLLLDTLAGIECDVVQRVETGDHSLFIGRLRSVDVRDRAPLVYYRGCYGTFGPF